MAKRVRKIWSIKSELLTKAREAMLSAVQIFNSPSIEFKSEIYIVLSNIAWTYLLHAYYREKKIDYKYYQRVGSRKRFDRTKRGAFKYWELERCLNDDESPLDKETASNLRFLIGIRHEIEHQMTNKIDDFLSAKFQACCLNFNQYIKSFFGDEHGIDRHLTFSLQFSSITDEHAKMLRDSDLPAHIYSYISDFDSHLEEDVFNSSRYSYRVFYVQKVANRKGQADKVIEFLRADSPEAEGLNKEYHVIKEREKPKYLPSDIVTMMKKKGYVKFNLHWHTQLWKDQKAKEPEKGFGVQVAKIWYWYESWIPVVEKFCQSNKDEFM